MEEGKYFGKITFTFYKKGCVRCSVVGYKSSTSDRWWLKLGFYPVLYWGGRSKTRGSCSRGRDKFIIRFGDTIGTVTNSGTGGKWEEILMLGGNMLFMDMP